MAGVPYRRDDYDLLDPAHSDAQWTITDQYLASLTLTCPQCGHSTTLSVPRGPGALLTAPTGRLYGWAVKDVPDDTYCRCNQEHAGRSDAVPKGCGAHFTGLKGLFRAQFLPPADGGEA